MDFGGHFLVKDQSEVFSSQMFCLELITCMNYYLAGSVTWGFRFQWCSRYRVNCRCSLGISQCKTLNELDELSMNSMSSRWTRWALNELSMNNAHINCHCSLGISQCKTLDELSMGNAHINLSMGNSQGRDMGLNCLTMEIVSTLNGHPLSGMEGWQKKPMKMWSFAKSPFTTHP